MELKKYTVFCFSLLGALFSGIVSAEVGQSLPPPPLARVIDSYGVDYLNGAANMPGMKVGIGGVGNGIARDPGRNWYGLDNFTGTMTEISVLSTQTDRFSPGYGLPVGEYVMVSTGDNSEMFVKNGTSYSAFEGAKGTFVCLANNPSFCYYTSNQGVSVKFDKTKSNGYSSDHRDNQVVTYKTKNVGMMVEITKPNGEIISITYMPNLYFDPQNKVLISAAVSSLGWMIKYQYSPNGYTTVAKPEAYDGVATRFSGADSVKAINLSEEYCSSGSEKCDNLSNNWPISSLDFFQDSYKKSSLSIDRDFESNVYDPQGNKYTYSYYENDALVTTKSQAYRFPSGVTHTYSFGSCSKYAMLNFCVTDADTGKVVDLSFSSVGFSYSRVEVGQQPTVENGLTLTKGSGPEGELVAHPRGKLRYFSDNLNRRRSYTYTDSQLSNIDKVVNPDATPSIESPTGGYTDYDYDQRGNITRITEYSKESGMTLVKSATYPPTCSNIKTCNKPDSITDENGVTTTFAYHAESGYVETITKPSVDGIQAQTRYKYEQKIPYVRNDSGNLVASTAVWVLTEVSECMSQSMNLCVNSEDEKRTVYSNFNNNLLPETLTVKIGDDSESLVTTTQYDIYGNVSSIDGPRSGTADKVYYFYNFMQQKTGEIGVDPDGAAGPLPRKAVKTTYNSDGKISRVDIGNTNGTTLASLNSMIVQQSSVTEYSPAHGLPIAEKFYAADVLEKVTQKSYDNKLRIECVAQRLNRSGWASLPNSACTLGPKGDEGNDRITKYTYDATGALLSTVSGLHTTLERIDRSSTYEPSNGLLSTETDGNGNTTNYRYDGFNRLFRTIYPIAGSGSTPSNSDFIQTNYKNSSSLVESIRLRDGLQINFSEYDALGRVKTKSGAVNETFIYNNFGQVVSRTNHSTGGLAQTSIYDFNALGWLESEARSSGTGTSNTSLGRVSYTYDATGRRETLTWPDNFSIKYVYTINGVIGEYLRQITESNGTLLAEFDYYDNGLRKSLTRGNGVVTSYEYNKLNQLDSQSSDIGGANTADDIDESFTYTLSGQLKTHTLDVSNNNYIFTPNAEVTTSYVPDALNRIASMNGAIFSYDGRGNLTQDNTGRTYAYNANNLLLNSTAAGVTTTLSYDAENRLHSVSKSGSTVKFMYDGTDLIAETNSDNAIQRRYVHGPETDDPIVWYEGSGAGDKRYYTANRQGSIVGVTLQSGMSTSVNSYDEYGVQKLSSIGRFQYTGQSWIPELGLYYYKARFYNSTLGRFMQTDPIGYKDGMNWYAYVGNDPVNMVDPTGLSGLFPANYQNVKSMYGYGIPGVPMPTRTPDFSTVSGGVSSITAGLSVICLGVCLPASPILAGISTSAGVTSAVTSDNPGKELAKEAVTLGVGRRIDALAETVKAVKNLDESGSKVDVAAGMVNIGVDEAVNSVIDNSAKTNSQSQSQSYRDANSIIVRTCSGVGAPKGGCPDL